jgi:hypothetical protein
LAGFFLFPFSNAHTPLERARVIIITYTLIGSPQNSAPPLKQTIDRPSREKDESNNNEEEGSSFRDRATATPCFIRPCAGRA